VLNTLGTKGLRSVRWIVGSAFLNVQIAIAEVRTVDLQLATPLSLMCHPHSPVASGRSEIVIGCRHESRAIDTDAPARLPHTCNTLAMEW
jgi:hypothetical protein